MASFLVPEEVIGIKRLGAISRNGAMLDSKNARIAIPLGRIVIQDAADDIDCDLPASGAEALTALGMSVYRAFREEGVTDDVYDIDEQVSILRKGTGYADCETAAVAGAQVFVVHTGGDEGKVRDDVDAGNAVALPGVRFAESIASTGLVQITLNLPS